MAEVEQARDRSQMPVSQSLKILGVAPRCYYFWVKEATWQRAPREPVRPVQVHEALPAKQHAVRKYALAIT